MDTVESKYSRKYCTVQYTQGYIDTFGSRV